MTAEFANMAFASSSLANQRPHHPIRVPQTIASGVLGARSYQDGLASAALGTVLHFAIALGATTVYYLASRKLKFWFAAPSCSLCCTVLQSTSSCI
jgi:hypothetical protein